MTDIVTRLRSWVRSVNTASANDVVDTDSARDRMEEAADEIERLRLAIRRLAEQDATLSVVGGNVIVEMECQGSSQENFALTDEEREAIRESCDEGRWYPKDYHHIHTLRGLLERLG